MPPDEFKDKFIAFIDILGFKQLVENAETGSGLTIAEIKELFGTLGSPDARQNFEIYGPTCCPDSQRIERHLDFRVSQVSDCAIVSSEISPAGVINLISHCWGSVIKLLPKGIMCRGYIGRGRIYHSEKDFIGTGYQSAIEAEKQVSVFKRTADERGTPFVEIDRAVCDYVADCEDACVQEMFMRMTEGDGESVALFPFKRLSHSFIIGGFGSPPFDPDKEKKSNDNLRKWILEFIQSVESLVDASNHDAVRKSEHYIHALKVQLDKCDQTDAMIDKLCMPAVQVRYPMNT
jgi:hypothetical protein